MDENYAPLVLDNPSIRTRARPANRPPRFAEFVKNQEEISQRVAAQIKPFVKQFSSFSAEQRRAIFYKISHKEMRIDLSGTGLRVFAEGDGYTLAGAKGESLEQLSQKIQQFGDIKPAGGHLANEYLVIPLTDFTAGSPTDRLSEELLARYAELIVADSIVYEIELMSNENYPNGQKTELQQLLNSLQAAITLNGVIFEHERVGNFVRAVVRTSGIIFKSLVEDSYWQTRITRFEQRPEFETFHTTLSEFQISSLKKIVSPPSEAATICIADTGVTACNPFLSPVVKIERCASFLTGNSDINDEYNHGSGVASLAAYQDLNLSIDASNEAHAWIVSARILDENNEMQVRLFSKVLFEVVNKYAKDGVRIFNLSVCVRNKTWNETERRASKRSSWVARKIDELSKEFDIVFVISSGNLSFQMVNGFLSDGAAYPSYFQSDECKILDPSQSVLAVTVGSIASSTTVLSGRAVAMSDQFLPSPFTRVGPGMLGEIKPEVVDFGGNWVVDAGVGRVRTDPGTNVMMASNKLTPALEHDSGTSYAAPRISHKLARILNDLSTVISEKISSSLLRAFLINSASASSDAEENQKTFQEQFKSVGSAARILGYGIPDLAKATFGDSYTVSCYFQGTIAVNKVAFFRIPIPIELVEATGKKRLHITLAYAPNVHTSGLKDYLGGKLNWRLFRGDASEEDVVESLSRQEVDEDDGDKTFEQLLNEDEKDIAVQDKETKEITKFKYGLRVRSKGTIQHDVFTWSQHKSEFSKNDYILAISSFKRWSNKSIPYALVLRLEEESLSVPIYSRIKNLLTRTQVRSRV
ncbi:MAG: S8 family peptidase [Candidatus Obscuribacterales bacterium]|nr:S8 family peptidase [Candidatus Obscuribacterales bacterium]